MQNFVTHSSRAANGGPLRRSLAAPSRMATRQFRTVRAALAFAAVVVVTASTSLAEGIRVGIEVFRAKPLSIGAYDELFHRASGRPGDSQVRLTIGSAADLLNWTAHGDVDIGVVSPELSRRIRSHRPGKGETGWETVAIELTPGTANPSAEVIASLSFKSRSEFAASLSAADPSRYTIPTTQPASNSAPLVAMQRQPLSLTTIGDLLTLHLCTQPDPPRLAVVFAGGGAKCSYQVGAIGSIEELLAELRSRFSEPHYDIALAAGTSGGALNALPVALGVSASDAGRRDFADTWADLDQRELIRPSNAIRYLMVLWFVCIQGIVLLRYRHVRHFKDPEKYPWIISPLFSFAGIAQIALARLPWRPWSLLGMNSALHHFWLWLSWGLEGSGWTLIALAALSQLLRRFPIVSRSSFPLRYRVVRRIFWTGVILIPLVQTVNIFLYQATLSDSSGIEGAVRRNFTRLIDKELSRNGVAPLDNAADDPSEALASIGKQLVGRHLLKRDLVLTGSALPKSTTEAPADLYFYASGQTASSPPRFGSRGVSLDDVPAVFMEVLMGSGAIYPVFPARPIHDFPEPGQTTEVVDGSFEHRSPVEAAVLWGATHIIVIQAATDEVSPRGSFFDNIMAAMNHLYDQAQLLDFRSREQAITLTLTPQPPHIGLLDFSDNLIRWAIEKGEREARGGLADSELHDPPYKKETSEPVFWTPPMRGRATAQCGTLAF